jgi:hypothetical protein
MAWFGGPARLISEPERGSLFGWLWGPAGLISERAMGALETIKGEHT